MRLPQWDDYKNHPLPEGTNMSRAEAMDWRVKLHKAAMERYYKANFPPLRSQDGRNVTGIPQAWDRRFAA